MFMHSLNFKCMLMSIKHFLGSQISSLILKFVLFIETHGRTANITFRLQSSYYNSEHGGRRPVKVVKYELLTVMDIRCGFL